MRLAHITLGLLVTACAAIDQHEGHEQPDFPLVAHHQHVASPAIATLAPGFAFDAERLIQGLDDAGIRREAKVRAENDWTAGQVARFPDRLVGFCSVNPLRSYALAELERCARLPQMIGLKLHFGNSGVSLRNPEHLARIQEVFRAANVRGSPVVLHMRARGGASYGGEDAEIFLREVLPLANDSVVQIAHLGGAGLYPDYADDVMQVFASAIAAGDRRTRLLYFDVTSVASNETTQENGALIATRLRQVGLNRVLFGSDLPLGGNPGPREAWEAFRSKVPLRDEEFQDIAESLAPYMR